MHIFSYSLFTFSVFCFLLIHLDAAFGKSHEARGTLTITSGVTYNPNLQDKLSVDFKVLAFDIQQMVRDLLSSTSLKFHNIVSLTTCQKLHRSCSLWKKLVNKCKCTYSYIYSYLNVWDPSSQRRKSLQYSSK